MTSSGQKRLVRLRGLELSIHEEGEGPPLLLVHGFLVNHREWLPILPYLRAHHRCIVPDLPGFGASEKRPPGGYPYTREAFAATMVALLDELGIERTHVCGHSMGGAISLVMAADHAARVDQLALIDAACYPFDVPFKGKLPLLPVIGPIVFKRLYGRRLFRDYFRNDVFSGHPGLDLAQVDSYYEAFRSREAKEAAYETLQNTVDLASLGPKIPRVQAETLVVWGDDDRIFPVGLAHRLVRELPSARLAVIGNSGHAPNEEHPRETAESILSHLGRHGDRAVATRDADHPGES